jgi:hypothetical protein
MKIQKKYYFKTKKYIISFKNIFKIQKQTKISKVIS